MGTEESKTPTDTGSVDSGTGATPRCRNCGVVLRGHYCHSCGQREGRGDLRFLQAVGEITGDVFTWDSRFWRTLIPLLFRPGFLTAEFIAGRRARYVPPFRLYLIISFITFLVLSLAANDAMVLVDEDAGEAIQAPITISANDKADTDDDEQPGASNEPNKVTSRGIDLGIDPNDPDTPRWAAHLNNRIEANAERIEQDPSIFLDRLMESLPQVMFFMLPCFALLLWLFYLFSPFHYLQHLVFGLHFHSFVYLLYMVSQGLGRAGLDIDWFTTLALLPYLPTALCNSYGSSVAGAIAKSLAIYAIYGAMLILVFGLVSVTVIALL